MFLFRLKRYYIIRRSGGIVLVYIIILYVHVYDTTHASSELSKPTMTMTYERFWPRRWFPGGVPPTFHGDLFLYISNNIYRRVKQPTKSIDIIGPRFLYNFLIVLFVKTAIAIFYFYIETIVLAVGAYRKSGIVVRRTVTATHIIVHVTYNIDIASHTYVVGMITMRKFVFVFRSIKYLNRYCSYLVTVFTVP